MRILKYDESASSRETERPMSTEGSHSSPRCSWVGDDGEGGGGGRCMGSGGSEEMARAGLADWLKSRERMKKEFDGLLDRFVFLSHDVVYPFYMSVYL